MSGDESPFSGSFGPPREASQAHRQCHRHRVGPCNSDVTRMLRDRTTQPAEWGRGRVGESVSSSILWKMSPDSRLRGYEKDCTDQDVKAWGKKEKVW